MLAAARGSRTPDRAHGLEELGWGAPNLGVQDYLSRPQDAVMKVRPRTSRDGFTLVEALVVLAVLAILIGVSAMTLRQPQARLLANDLKVVFQQGRYEAIKTNRPIAVVFNETSDTVEVRLAPASQDPSSQCGGTTVVRSRDTSEYPQADITLESTSNGIVWLPSGQARDCDGSIASGIRLRIADVRTSASVVVHPTGRAEVQ